MTRFRFIKARMQNRQKQTFLKEMSEVRPGFIISKFSTANHSGFSKAGVQTLQMEPDLGYPPGFSGRDRQEFEQISFQVQQGHRVTGCPMKCAWVDMPGPAIPVIKRKMAVTEEEIVWFVCNQTEERLGVMPMSHANPLAMQGQKAPLLQILSPGLFDCLA